MYDNRKFKREDILVENAKKLKEMFCKEYNSCDKCLAVIRYNHKPTTCMFELIESRKNISDIVNERKGAV